MPTHNGHIQTTNEMSTEVPSTPEPLAPFIAAQRFTGDRDGYSFREGTSGRGYYLEENPSRYILEEAQLINEERQDAQIVERANNRIAVEISRVRRDLLNSFTIDESLLSNTSAPLVRSGQSRMSYAQAVRSSVRAVVSRHPDVTPTSERPALLEEISASAISAISALQPASVEISLPGQAVISDAAAEMVARLGIAGAMAAEQQPTLRSAEETLEEECAEALRTVMAIIFEHKQDLGDKDYLEATDLLKKVYEGKDPRNLRAELFEANQMTSDIYETVREARGENRYYRNLNTNLLKENECMKRRLTVQSDSIKTHLMGVASLREDIEDLKYENDRLWKTKFRYQNQLVNLGDDHPEVLGPQLKQEIATIKKRKNWKETPSVLDSMKKVRVKIEYEGGTAKVNLEPCDYEPQLSILSK